MDKIELHDHFLQMEDLRMVKKLVQKAIQNNTLVHLKTGMGYIQGRLHIEHNTTLKVVSGDMPAVNVEGAVAWFTLYDIKSIFERTDGILAIELEK